MTPNKIFIAKILSSIRFVLKILLDIVFFFYEYTT